MYREITVNMSLETLLSAMCYENAVDCIRVLHGVFGISNKRLAELMGITPSQLSQATRYGCFDMLVSEKKMELGIRSLRTFYLDKFFTE